jgi:hypothetical protein
MKLWIIADGNQAIGPEKGSSGSSATEMEPSMLENQTIGPENEVVDHWCVKIKPSVQKMKQWIIDA